jgi:hypothetical protein
LVGKDDITPIVKNYLDDPSEIEPLTHYTADTNCPITKCEWEGIKPGYIDMESVSPWKITITSKTPTIRTTGAVATKAQFKCSNADQLLVKIKLFTVVINKICYNNLKFVSDSTEVWTNTQSYHAINRYEAGPGFALGDEKLRTNVNFGFTT